MHYTVPSESMHRCPGLVSCTQKSETSPSRLKKITTSVVARLKTVYMYVMCMHATQVQVATIYCA